MSDTTKDQDKLTKKETAKKRDETLKRMLNTPPKPRPPSKRETKEGL